jgi:hypothetical protein
MEVPFFRSFLHCVSYVVHCPLSEIYLIYFRQWQIFNITLDNLLSFRFMLSVATVSMPCWTVITLSSADPGGRVI